MAPKHAHKEAALLYGTMRTPSLSSARHQFTAPPTTTTANSDNSDSSDSDDDDLPPGIDYETR